MSRKNNETWGTPRLSVPRLLNNREVKATIGYSLHEKWCIHVVSG
jgi:hypothetical protein